MVMFVDQRSVKQEYQTKIFVLRNILQIKEPLRELRKDDHSLHKSLAALEAARKHSKHRQAEMREAVRKRGEVLCGLIKDYQEVLLMEVDRRHTRNLEAIKEKEDVVKVCWTLIPLNL